MARRKHRSGSSRERDNNNIASNKLLTHSVNSLLSEIEDRRLYSPEREPRARGLSEGSAIIGISPVRQAPRRSKGGKFAPDVLRFNKPASVAVCVRRHRRKEVLFALKRTGKGSKAKRRRNSFSDVSCK